MTHRPAEARDACAPIFASAGALAFVNASSEAAAPPALSQAFAERQQAWPLAPRYPTEGAHPCRHKPPQPVRPLWASTGLRRTTSTLSRRRRPPNRGGQGAGHGTQRHAIVGPRAPPVATVPATHGWRGGGGSHPAGLLGAGLCAAATRARQGTPGCRARLGLPRAPPPLSVLAGAHPGGGIWLSPSAPTPQRTSPAPACGGILQEVNKP